MSYREPNLDLFGEPPPQTDREASARRLRGHARTVYEWILGRGVHGGTRSEAAAALSILDQSLGRVFGDLEELHLIEDTGDTRATASGREARVFVAVEEAVG